MTIMPKRCSWAEKEIFHDYHDCEWGVSVYNDFELFEFLVLEGAQAGLSWETILKKRDEYKKVFANFDPEKVSKFTKADQKKILKNPGIVRNRLKVASAVRNAKAFLNVQKEFGSFDSYIWGFVNGKKISNDVRSLNDVPTTTSLSDEVSNDLKKRGFNFVGSTIIYAYLQAIGIVDDHENDCFRKNK